MTKKTLIYVICSVFLIEVFAEKTTIYLEHSETLSFDQERMPDCQILGGNVQFRHDNALMFCDSAFFHDKQNTIDAFGNIRIEQGDSIFVYGDKLHYEGNIKLAKLRHHVRMIKDGMTLYTDSLNYDRELNVGYYFNKGKIVDSTNVLTSINGHYYPNTNTAVFQKDVVLTNPDFILYSDTLKYNTATDIAYILGPSTILYDSTTIYSEYGWYDTKQEHSKLIDNSIIKDKEGRTLTADTIYYNRKNNIAKGYINVQLRDSVQKSMLVGDYGIYNEMTKMGSMTKKATFIDFSSADSLFLTGDTLFYASSDSVTSIRGYYNVQSWQKDFQLICDSMYYSTQDSIMRMFGTPIAWNENNQITGDSIYLLTKDNKVNKILVQGAAFMFMKSDSTEYNQVSGKQFTGYVKDEHLYKLFVDGNALSIYFVKEEADSTEEATSDSAEYIGINKAESSELTIYIGQDNKPERIVMTPASNGTMYTPDKRTNLELTRLKGFIDCASLRPKDKIDIYNKKDKHLLKQQSAAQPRYKRKER
jgi:lipopolysaccharide export system protein LptA